MKIEDLMQHVRQWQEASRMPAGTAHSVMPLMITQSLLDEMVDGTELTAAQWLLAASRGIMVIPDDFEYYPA